eukprot:1139300-Pelagomonas_calceolata.AAC.1
MHFTCLSCLCHDGCSLGQLTPPPKKRDPGMGTLRCRPSAYTLTAQLNKALQSQDKGLHRPRKGANFRIPPAPQHTHSPAAGIVGITHLRSVGAQTIKGTSRERVGSEARHPGV